MSQLTTHILDTSTGKPAQGIMIILEQSVNHNPIAIGWKVIADGTTNKDGRVSDLLDEKEILAKGIYRLIFETSPYFKKRKVKSFYPKVTVEFEITDASHYHVPLLLNPYGYSTYRGS